MNSNSTFKVNKTTLKRLVKEEQEKIDAELSLQKDEKIPEVEIPESLQKVDQFMELAPDQQIKLTFILGLAMRQADEHHVGVLTDDEIDEALSKNGYNVEEEYSWVKVKKRHFPQWYVNLIVMLHFRRFAKQESDKTINS